MEVSSSTVRSSSGQETKSSSSPGAARIRRMIKPAWNRRTITRYAECGFYYRYDTEEERDVLTRLWEKVCIKLNYFTPTRKPIGYTQDAVGRRKRVYDAPATPMDRLIASGTLSAAQIQDLQAPRGRVNPAELTRDILRFQDQLIALAKAKTEQLSFEVEAAKQKRQSGLTRDIKTRTA